MPVSATAFKYEPVEMFYHRNHDHSTNFILLQTASDKKLVISPLHLLPIRNCEHFNELLQSNGGTAQTVDDCLRDSVFAKRATVGDCLLTVSNNGTMHTDRIVKVRQRVTGYGYAQQS